MSLKDHTSTFFETFQIAAEMNKRIELDSSTVDEIEKTLASCDYHMGDFISDFRSIRDILYSYERHQHPSHDGQNTNVITKDELQTLILMCCGIMRAMKKREAYLEGKVEDLQNKLDKIQLVQDDWVMVTEADLGDMTGGHMMSRHWYYRRPWG